MELISQHTKKIMEGCKERAAEAGLNFGKETLEYIVTNRDLIELSPKLMIPTLYDFWVHDVEVLKETGRYELYPNNPYETVINTRPAISFYNDNNPDWLNVMIFYHVLAHIDFFYNNHYFKNTWDFDFAGQALSDKRSIASLRSEKGRWVDYVLEFSRSIDNLIGYHHELAKSDIPAPFRTTRRLDFYFDTFLQLHQKVSIAEFIKEVERYNQAVREYGDEGEKTFFADALKKYPEFESAYFKEVEEPTPGRTDVMQFIMEHSPFINKSANRWMKTILQIVRNTSLVFQPQIRTKIMNEGWASYWHEKLFLADDRICGHESDFARVHSAVASIPRVGLNPYALGIRLFYYIEELGDKGRYSFEYQNLKDSYLREKFDKKEAKGNDLIFAIRENLCDYSFITTFLDQDFMTKYDLFVAGKRFNKNRMVIEYYVKSRKAAEFRDMLTKSMYHPPVIEVNEEKSSKGELYLNHVFEHKPLVNDYINNTLMGISYLWGGAVHLETSIVKSISSSATSTGTGGNEPKISWQRVVYTMKDKKLSKKSL